MNCRYILFQFIVTQAGGKVKGGAAASFNPRFIIF